MLLAALYFSFKQNLLFFKVLLTFNELNLKTQHHKSFYKVKLLKFCLLDLC